MPAPEYIAGHPARLSAGVRESPEPYDNWPLLRRDPPGWDARNLPARPLPSRTPSPTPPPVPGLRPFHSPGDPDTLERAARPAFAREWIPANPEWHRGTRRGR